MTFLIFSTDILYALRAPFNENYLRYMVSLLGFRYGILGIVWLWWCQRNQEGSESSIHQSRNSSNNQTGPNSLFGLLRNLRGMPILIALGFYKLLPNKDFRSEILLGYIVEIITSLLPMLSVQVMNNSAMVGSLTWLKVTSLTFRIVSLLLFIIEAVIFIWESFINFKMRDTNIRRYKKLTGQ